MEGHWGCPECGSTNFSAWQGYTEWGCEKVYCHYTGDDQDDEDYETDDFGDRFTNESESGDMESTRECMECGHEYTQPEFFPDGPDLEQLLEEHFNRDLADTLLSIVTDKACYAGDFEVELAPHATLLLAKAKQKVVGVHPRNKRTIEYCPGCMCDMSTSRTRSEELYGSNPHTPSGRRTLRDSRGLPIILVLPLCIQCNPN